MLGTTVLGIFLLVLGVIKIRKSSKVMDDLKRYEFENTTDGGTVKFTNYEESQNHEINKKRAELVAALSVFSMFFGVIFLSIALFIYKN